MELTEHSVWILPALELNLCLQMLGAGERQVLPVARTDTPLDHRMLNSFLYLLELGLVETEGARFRPSQKLRRRLEPVASPVQILRLGRNLSSRPIWARRPSPWPGSRARTGRAAGSAP